MQCLRCRYGSGPRGRLDEASLLPRQNAFVRYFEKRKTWRSLLELTAAQLNDIGVTPEAARPKRRNPGFGSSAPAPTHDAAFEADRSLTSHGCTRPGFHLLSHN
ncbi:DUF1127 domain-containing protein [Rhizobium mongolense]|uniref:DUF1127 domain-containing protein n=1 Tax=Rhizobium mongolense TaxID=57676 RepID=UPI000B830967